MSQIEIIQTCRKYSGLPNECLADLWLACEGTEDLPGAAVECGVCAGGSGAALWHASGGKRDLWLFDSFEGMPAPTPEDGGRAYCQYEYRTQKPEGWNVGSIENVRKVLELVGAPKKLTHIVKGWFADTLPKYASKIGPIAALHLDADFYAPTKIALRYLYPLVISGGVVIVDDYGGWQGCKQAVDEFIQERQIQYLRALTGSVVMWIKDGEI